ncbi:hypothetical protein [Nonomuraea basaltis]|uniref:hypothetical protein n=1 Tax=Nonomuraea basaltis TaxID=2495887 RepID=UPI00110C6A93|nr:hypothetical protein [Nonomuraea basaltis]TMR99557.1 hypothetical protein EJK15_07020 [Nonomuraea basaltis]
MTSDTVNGSNPLGINPSDPLGSFFTDDTIQMLVAKRNALLGQAEEVRQQADKQISALKRQARELEALIRYADQNRDTGNASIPATRRCGCGRDAYWMTGFGFYHDIDGQAAPAMEQCKGEPLPNNAEPARLPEPSRA